MNGIPLSGDVVPWSDIPAVRIVGLVIGAVLLFAAIRAMFGGGGGGKGRR